MSDHTEAKDSELLIELTEPEQEVVTGGDRNMNMDMFESFFFQKTEISTFADAETNFSSTGISSSHRTGYHLSQITLAFTSPRSGRNRSRYGRSWMSNIFKLLRAWGD